MFISEISTDLAWGKTEMSNIDSKYSQLASIIIVDLQLFTIIVNLINNSKSIVENYEVFKSQIEVKSLATIELKDQCNGSNQKQPA